MSNESKQFTVRLPVSAIEAMGTLAKLQYSPTRTMVRGWIMQRLESELKKREKEERDEAIE